MRFDKGIWFAGIFDVFCILRDVLTGRFHPAIFEAEYPPQLDDDEDLGRKLILCNFHKNGFMTLEEALSELENGLTKVDCVQDNNVIREPVEWDGNEHEVRIPYWNFGCEKPRMDLMKKNEPKVKTKPQKVHHVLN